MPKFGHTVINYNTLLIVDLATQEQRYAHNVTLPCLYNVLFTQSPILIMLCSSVAVVVH